MIASDHDAEPRLTIVHDYLTQRGGAERVVLAMLKIFPKARLATLLFDRDSTFPEFADFDIQVGCLNRFRTFRQDPRLALPLLPRAVRRLPITDTDVVLCSSSGWAHGVSTTAAKIVYCYSPARWLYQTQDYMRHRSVQAKLALASRKRHLLKWDAARAAEAAIYLTSSSSVASRILQTYGIEAQIVPPPVTIAGHESHQPVRGLEPGYFLIVGRNRGYKHLDVACTAFRYLPTHRLVVVGELPPANGEPEWPSNIATVQNCSDAELRWLYANCRAVIGLAHEDFGLTPLEGNSFGKPALVLRAGGYLDTLVEGVTGLFIEAPESRDVVDGIHRLLGVKFDEAKIRNHSTKYSIEAFGDRLRSVVIKAHRLQMAPIPNVRSRSLQVQEDAGFVTE